MALEAAAAVVPFGDILEGAKVRYTTIDGSPYSPFETLSWWFLVKTTTQHAERGVEILRRNNIENSRITSHNFSFQGLDKNFKMSYCTKELSNSSCGYLEK